MFSFQLNLSPPKTTLARAHTAAASSSETSYLSWWGFKKSLFTRFSHKTEKEQPSNENHPWVPAEVEFWLWTKSRLVVISSSPPHSLTPCPQYNFHSSHWCVTSPFPGGCLWPTDTQAPLDWTPLFLCLKWGYALTSPQLIKLSHAANGNEIIWDL